MIPTMARSYCSVWIIDISRQLMIADKNMYTSVQDLDIDATYPQICNIKQTYKQRAVP